jgi:hypothetical protein
VKIRAFVSFDLDHDHDLELQLCDQAKGPNSRVNVFDSSVRGTASDWHDKLRKRVSNVDLLIVLCGAYTDRAANVHAELELARAGAVPYLLLDGRSELSKKPTAARTTDRLVAWNAHTLTTLGTKVAAENFGDSIDDNWLPSTRTTRRRRR